MSDAETPQADTATAPVERVNVSHALGPRSAARYAAVQAQRAAAEPTVPTTVAMEQATNPFLRCREPALQQTTGTTEPVAVLAEIRRRKDVF